MVSEYVFPEEMSVLYPEAAFLSAERDALYEELKRTLTTPVLRGKEIILHHDLENQSPDGSYTGQALSELNALPFA